MSLGRYFIWLVAAFFFVPTAASAQEMARPGLPSPLNLQDAVHYALAHHPALRARHTSREKTRARIPAFPSRRL